MMTRKDLLAVIEDMDAFCNAEKHNWKGFWTREWAVEEIEFVITTTDEYGERTRQRLSFRPEKPSLAMPSS